uniref:Polysaccharide deacetylase n=1 Tax=Candidatus Kentrum sp. TUN TaxID=2126343 RepID=A0A450ZUX0_9GAMM|nr:MAG: Polysaccharide deacetylase [Candidatus Kentron sp. TUN]VFK57612.1 MAG: Polysaccharide deacetylase [Candidatus Kentron sp. TUN]VFK61506.1 MAG: Polysaccharide deacetylase [Candidatus Kentron sp. TUN]
MYLLQSVLFLFSLLLLFLFSRRYTWWRFPIDYQAPRILMYHMVHEHKARTTFNKLRVTPNRFERQIGWLEEHGWYFAFISELTNPEKLPNKTVCITFDDGYRDNFTHVHPLLKKHHARATLYLVADRFDRDWSINKKAHHNSGELEREPKLTDSQIRAMLNSGHWQLGGHTMTHANLSRLDEEGKHAEIFHAKTLLERNFETSLRSFAYPFGIYDESDVMIVAEAGFETAVTTRSGISQDIPRECLELKRIKISGKDNMLVFCLKMRSGS